jgi:hypothetical protein
MGPISGAGFGESVKGLRQNTLAGYHRRATALPFFRVDRRWPSHAVLTC